jgi:hypothetical protein
MKLLSMLGILEYVILSKYLCKNILKKHNRIFGLAPGGALEGGGFLDGSYNLQTNLL